MRTEVTKQDIESFDLGLDRKYIWADSPICHYCARCNSRDLEFDEDKCNECVHGKYGRMTGINHFLGIQCVTWKEE